MSIGARAHLGEGCILRTKLVLGKILKPAGVPLDKVKEYNLPHNFSFNVYAPLDKKGAPETRPLTPKLIEESIVEDIDPKPIKTQVNEYRLTNDTIIRLRAMLTRVAKTNLYGADASPVYVVNYQVVPQIIMSKTTRPSSRTKMAV